MSAIIAGLLRRAAALGLLAVLAGCIPESRQPLGIPGDFAFDDSAVGVWVADIDGIPTELHVTRRSDVVLDVVTYENWGDLEAGEDDWERYDYQVYASSVGDYYVLNIAFATDTGTLYYFADFVLGDDGGLTLYFMNLDAVIREINAGTLAGEVESDEYDDYATITAQPEAIVAMIRSYPREEIFDYQYGPFYRSY